MQLNIGVEFSQRNYTVSNLNLYTAKTNRKQVKQRMDIHTSDKQVAYSSILIFNSLGNNATFEACMIKLLYGFKVMLLL